MENNTKGNSALPEAAMAILNSLSNMNAEFSFDFDNIEIQLPSENPNQNTNVRVNGSLLIKAKGNQKNS